MRIKGYAPDNKQDFILLNIRRFMKTETELTEAQKRFFDSIDKLISNGAMIFFAMENQSARSTCMARPRTRRTWEICILASEEDTDELYEIGVIDSAIEWAAANLAESVFFSFEKYEKQRQAICDRLGMKIQTENRYQEITELIVGIFHQEIIAAMIVNHSFSEYEYSEWQKDHNPDDVKIIHQLLVHPNYRRRGVASEMIQHVISNAQRTGKTKVQMDIPKEDDAAKQVVQNLDFRFISTLTLSSGEKGVEEYELFELETTKK